MVDVATQLASEFIGELLVATQAISLLFIPSKANFEWTMYGTSGRLAGGQLAFTKLEFEIKTNSANSTDLQLD